MSRDDLLALFAKKATAPPPEANQLLAMHLQCKASLHLASAVSAALNVCVGGDPVPLSTPSPLLPATNVITLAPPWPQALPSFDEVPAHYSHEVNGELLCKLCAALTAKGLAHPKRG